MPRTRPRESPPGTKAKTEGETAAVGTTQPKPMTEEQLADVLEAETEIEGRPTLDPSSVAGLTARAEGVGAITGTWRSGATVTAMWSINETPQRVVLHPGLRLAKDLQRPRRCVQSLGHPRRPRSPDGPPDQFPRGSGRHGLRDLLLVIRCGGREAVDVGFASPDGDERLEPVDRFALPTGA